MLALFNPLRHTLPVANTNATWFGDQNRSGGRSAIERIFYVPTLLRTLYGRAIAGIPSGMPGSLISGSPTLLSARPPHLAMDGGPNLIREAANG